MHDIGQSMDVDQRTKLVPIVGALNRAHALSRLGQPIRRHRIADAALPEYALLAKIMIIPRHRQQRRLGAIVIGRARSRIPSPSTASRRFTLGVLLEVELGIDGADETHAACLFVALWIVVPHADSPLIARLITPLVGDVAAIRAA